MGSIAPSTNSPHPPPASDPWLTPNDLFRGQSNDNSCPPDDYKTVLATNAAASLIEKSFGHLDVAGHSDALVTLQRFAE